MDFVVKGRHLPAATGGREHHFGSQAHGTARHVNGRIPAANDRHPALDDRCLSFPHLLQQRQAVLNRFRARSRHFQAPPRTMTAHEQDRLVRCLEPGQGRLGKLCPTVNLHPQLDNARYFLLQGRRCQAVRGNPPPRGASRFGHGFVNVTRITQPGEEVGPGQPAGTGAEDGNPLPAGRPVLERGSPPMANGIVCQEPFDRVDGDGVVEFTPVAGLFAGMMTDAAADRWERVFAEDRLPRFPELSPTRQQLDSADVFACRAGHTAGGGLFLVTGSKKPPAAGLVAFGGEAGPRYEKRDRFLFFLGHG